MEPSKKKSCRVLLTFADGQTRQAVREDQKYWYCEGAQYRKKNPAILSAEKQSTDRKEKKDHA